MKELYELVIKKISNTEDEDIFYPNHYEYYCGETEQPLFYGMNEVYKHNYTGAVLDFTLKFPDGKPDLVIRPAENFEVIETKRIVHRAKFSFSAYKVIETVKEEPLYVIKAGMLSYELNLQESRELLKAHDDLTERRNEITRESERKIILKRLDDETKHKDL